MGANSTKIDDSQIDDENDDGEVDTEVDAEPEVVAEAQPEPEPEPLPEPEADSDEKVEKDEGVEITQKNDTANETIDVSEILFNIHFYINQ